MWTVIHVHTPELHISLHSSEEEEDLEDASEDVAPSDDDAPRNEDSASEADESSTDDGSSSDDDIAQHPAFSEDGDLDEDVLCSFWFPGVGDRWPRLCSLCEQVTVDAKVDPDRVLRCAECRSGEKRKATKHGKRNSKKRARAVSAERLDGRKRRRTAEPALSALRIRNGMVSCPRCPARKGATEMRRHWRERCTVTPRFTEAEIRILLPPMRQRPRRSLATR